MMRWAKRLSDGLYNTVISNNSNGESSKKTLLRCKMMAQSIIGLDAQAVDSQQIKSIQKVKYNPIAFLKILTALKEQLKKEKSVQIDPNLMKSKRTIMLAKKHEIILLFEMEIEQMLFCLEDNASFILNYHTHRYHMHHKLILYCQRTEEYLASQKNKLLNRITGFTKEIIDNIFDEKVDENTAKHNLFNAIIFKLQDCGRKLAGDNYLPELALFDDLFMNVTCHTIKSCNPGFGGIEVKSSPQKAAKPVNTRQSFLTSSNNNSVASIDTSITPLQEPIVLLNALQYLHQLASHNTATIFKRQKDPKKDKDLKGQYSALLTRFNKIIPFAFSLLRIMSENRPHHQHSTSSASSSMNPDTIGIYLTQTVKTVRAVLNVMVSLHLEKLDNRKQNEAIVAENAVIAARLAEEAARSRQTEDEPAVEFGAIKNKQKSVVSAKETPPVLSISAVFWDECFSCDQYTYTLTHLATDLVLLLKVVKLARVCNYSGSGGLSVFCVHGELPPVDAMTTDDHYGFTSGSNNNNHNSNINSGSSSSSIPMSSFSRLVGNLAPYAAIGNSLATDILHCADNVVNLLAHTAFSPLVPVLTSLSSPASAAAPSNAPPVKTTQTSNNNYFSNKPNTSNNNNSIAIAPIVTTNVNKPPIIFDSLPHELLLTALQLGHTCMQQYSSRLGSNNNLSSYVLCDHNYVVNCDKESVAALNLAASSFAHNILQCEALLIMKLGYDLSVPRSTNLLLMNSYLKCVLAAALCVMHNDDVSQELCEDKTRARVSAATKGATSSDFPVSAPGANTNTTNTTTLNTISQVASPKVIAAVNKQVNKTLASALPTATQPNSKAAPNSKSSSSGLVKHISFSDDSKNLNATIAHIETSMSTAKPRLIQPGALVPFKLAKRQDVISALSEGAGRVMGVMFVHRNSLSIACTGLLVVRLLTRDLFLRKVRIDALLTTHLAYVLHPLQELHLQKKQAEEEDEEEGAATTPTATSGGGTAGSGNNGGGVTESNPGSADNSFYKSKGDSHNNSYNSLSSIPGVTDLSTVSHSRPNSADTTLLPEASGGVSNGPSVTDTGASSSFHQRSYGSHSSSASSKDRKNTGAEHLKKWKTTHLFSLLDGNAKHSSLDMTFVELLQYIGENHMQCAEVLEHFLLLVEHLASKSQLNKYLLVECNVPPIVQRVRETHHRNVYFSALSEICLTLLEV